jgi:hypothetical protein
MLLFGKGALPFICKHGRESIQPWQCWDLPLAHIERLEEKVGCSIAGVTRSYPPPTSQPYLILTFACHHLSSSGQGKTMQSPTGILGLKESTGLRTWSTSHTYQRIGISWFNKPRDSGRFRKQCVHLCLPVISAIDSYSHHRRQPVLFVQEKSVSWLQCNNLKQGT